MYRQYHLKLETDSIKKHSVYTMAWLDSKGVHPVGTRLSLKNDERIWLVVDVGTKELDKPPRQDWNVGGVNEERR